MRLPSSAVPGPLPRDRRRGKPLSSSIATAPTHKEQVMRTTSRGIVGAALLALTLAGCAGSGGDEVSGNVTGSGVAKSAGCTGYQAETVQAFTTETGSCQVDGKDIYVMTFKDSKLRDQWLEIGRMAGGSFGEGDRWILQGDDRATVEKAVKAAGGKMT